MFSAIVYRSFLLGLVDLAVNVARGYELVVRTFGGDVVVVEDDYLVGVADGAYALGDDDDRRVLQVLAEGAAYLRRGGGVPGGGGVVQYDNRRMRAMQSRCF